MENIAYTTYKKEKVTKKWLLQNGFQFNRLFSSEESEVYTCRFPVYEYGEFITLECELMVDRSTGEVKINVYDNNTRSRYAPFYVYQYGSARPILTKIHKRIKRKIKALGIKNWNNYEKNF